MTFSTVSRSASRSSSGDAAFMFSATLCRNCFTSAAVISRSALAAALSASMPSIDAAIFSRSSSSASIWRSSASGALVSLIRSASRAVFLSISAMRFFIAAVSAGVFAAARSLR
ncbi:MAG: hypothetical protein FWD67_08120 [Betaproteobacteria bacterium]|nr:hypothetical protein [Betaproteobacteria bacterium]